VTIRELYRRNRRDWFGPGRISIDRKRKLYGLQMVVFHTIGDYLIEVEGLHPDDEIGWRTNCILRGERNLNALRALLRINERLVDAQFDRPCRSCGEAEALPGDTCCAACIPASELIYMPAHACGAD